MAVAGACIRNFIDARVMTVQDCIKKTEKSEPPLCRVLCIPNFYVNSNDGGHIAKWNISGLYDLLLRRYTLELQTVVYVQDMKMLAQEYGNSMAEHLKKHFYSI
jgi:hypothetical protein